ncbi:hypothetical protein Tco_1397958 [Tanacetum coccineum]
MSTSNQQTLADSGANERPLMLEKGNYIPRESRFRRFSDNKLEDGEQMWNSIQNKPCKRPMITNPDNSQEEILEPLLMFGSDVTSHVRHSRLMDEFDKFAAKEGESLESVYERLTTLVNIMDRNNVRPIPVSINTKFLKCLQPEWIKYVTMVRHSQTGGIVSYDVFPSCLLKCFFITSHANSSYSQPYYVTHPSSVVDYEDEYQGELQGDSQEDKLTTAMMLLARAITQKFSTPTNTRLRTSSNTKDQAVECREKKNRNQAFNFKNGNDDNNQIVQRVPRTDSNPGKANVQFYNCNEKGHYASDYQKPRVCDAKYFREQMLLAMKDEAGSNLKDKENDFLLDKSYREETMEELTAAIMLMARIQPADVSHVKCKTIIQTSDDDQIDSNIIFDDPYVENNGGTSEHDSNAHDEYHEIQMLAYNVQREAKKKRLINELKKQKELLQKELETSKKAFREQENRYLEDIVDLEEKLSSHDRIVYKMSQSIQTIHMLEKKPNNVYDPSLKAGFGYKNLERLKKAIAAQKKCMMMKGFIVLN